MIRHYNVTPGFISRILLGIVSLLLVANLFCVFARTYFGLSFHTINQFYFNTEGNLPTIFSFILLVICSVLLWIVSNMPGEIERKKVVYWKMLSVIFLFVALDELISIHETLTDNTRALLDDFARGYLYFAWVIPYVIIFSIALILLIRFFASLPGPTKVQFAIAACTYVIGAVGLEMIAGNYISDEGEQAKQSLPYMLMATVEELLEMIGLIVFISALVKYYLGNVGEKTVVVTLNFNKQQ